ncbi:MAG: bifunctional enoyl-CoA hydratase/phosphate acetyltransferase [Acidiferrobacter sp.]
MTLASLEALLDLVAPLPRLPAVVVDAGEECVLRGACEARDHGLIEPILIGDKHRIEELLGKIDSTTSDHPTFRIIPASNPEVAAEKGVEMILSGEAQIVIKGHIHSDAFLHPILAKLRTDRRLSHVFIAEMKTYRKLLFITDAAINISPGLLDKAAILQNAIDLAHLLDIPEPQVACLSAVEVINPAIPSTMDAACLAKMADRGQITGAIVDGPLAFDNAISAESARIKGIRSSVAGNTDILLVPDLVSGNILAKDLEYLAGATLAGIVLGARVPVILTSRSDPPRARLVSAALAVLIHSRSLKGPLA